MRVENTPQIQGFFAVILAALLWAASGSSAKYLFNAGLSPFDLVQIRLTIATACIGLLLAFRAPEKLRIPLKSLPGYLFLGICGMAAMQATYLLAISRIQVAAAILLQYLAPAFIALWQICFQGHRLTLRTLIALCAALTGCALVLDLPAMQWRSMDLTGILAGLAAALTFALYSLAGEARMQKEAPETVVFYAMLIACILWHILLPPFSGFAALGNQDASWILAMAIGSLGTALPFFLYLYGIRCIGAAPASITGTLEPVFAGFLCFFFLSEILNIFQMTGATFVISAIILLQLPEKHPRHRKVSPS
jgi:drug/metabolite transporter (DMT)-like permease